ncbi:MAG: hypothetical protein QOD92_1577 [Acidimicrobiaceae bacterium]|jgi:hypothetical protein
MPPRPPGPPTNGSATAGFICGLVGFIICLIPFGIFLGGVVAVVGIVFGVLGRSRAREVGVGRSQATAGLTLGIAGLVVGVLWLIAFRSVFTSVRHSLEVRDGDFIVNSETCRAIEGSFVTTSGEITNTSGDDKLLVQVEVTVRDSAGFIVGENQEFVGSVDAGETHPYFVRVVVDQTVSEPHCEVAVR